ncbi:hypothetical protein ACFQMA_23630 [Halosimplex aquaticum]|uniref:DUF8060 domain-containing protein n=1 Tax=Halosimplex aquaticum TaxID=3026162 RepID=A0ABD5XYR0_9EURY|nr:hypothetical protein [Halosimplex aquaticum]
MTDTDTDDATGGRTDATTDDPSSEPAAVERSTDGGATATGEPEGRDLLAYVEWAAFGILCLLALVATFRFYFAASEAIRVWFSADFVPVFQAVFNLLVLVASALGISVLVRRIA